MIELRLANSRTDRRTADLDRLVRAEGSADSGFLRFAMDTLGIPEDEREGNWIGGLAVPFGETYMPEGMGWGERFHPDAFDETLAEADGGEWRIGVCSSHDCNVATGLLGSTASAGEMAARYWVEKKDRDGYEAGLYVLCRVAEFDGSPGQIVSEQIARGGVGGLSIGFRIRDEHPAETIDEVLVFEVTRVRLWETSPVEKPAYSRTWAVSGEVRPGDHDPERDEIKSLAESMYRLNRDWQKFNENEDMSVEQRCAADTKAMRDIIADISDRLDKLERKDSPQPSEVLAVPV